MNLKSILKRAIPGPRFTPVDRAANDRAPARSAAPLRPTVYCPPSEVDDCVTEAARNAHAP